VLFSDVAPTLFILFILSHGTADGKIQTDHRGNYESFTTKAVFEALKKNEFLKDALKLVFLGVSLKIYNLSLIQNEASPNLI
jgi:hypothetical protein